jgi:hypothetical protein
MNSPRFFLAFATLVLTIAICLIFLYARGMLFAQTTAAINDTPIACFAAAPSLPSNPESEAQLDTGLPLTWTNITTTAWITHSQLTEMITNTLPLSSCKSLS